MNPAPNALHLDPQRGVGWYGVAQTMTLHLLAIQFSLANPRGLSWLQMSSPVLPDPPGPLWRRAFLHPSLKCSPACPRAYLAELSSLELLHLGGLVAGASPLASFQRREQAAEQEMCRDRRRAFAPVAPARGLGDARAQALPSVGCGCGARAGLCSANAFLSLRRARDWGGVHGCARVNT